MSLATVAKTKARCNTYLGVLLSEVLSFSPHIGEVSQKASSNLGFISRNLKGCPERPSLEYASSVWDPHTRPDIDKLEKIQCRAACFVKGYSRYRRADTDNKTSRDLINILKWDSLASRRKMSRLCMLYKAVKGEVALPTHILQTADHRVRNSAYKYKHLPAKKSALANSFYNRTVSDWNILKVEVKLAPSPAAFKARLLQSSY